MPGYPKGIYKDFAGDGVIDISDGSLHDIKIVVKDTYGNQSTLQFQIKKNLQVKQNKRPDSMAYYQQNEFHPGFVNIFDRDDIQLIFYEHDLYDSITLLTSKKLP